MTGRVENGYVGGVVDDAVVERVGRHVVERLQDPGHHQALAGEGERREQLVQQLGRHRARSAAHEAVQGVAVRSFRGDEMTSEVTEQPARFLQPRVIQVVARPDHDLQHAQTLDAVHERKPDRVPSVGE
jgi:hypothetical protein